MGGESNMKKKKLAKRILIVIVVLLLPIGAFTLGYFFKEDKIEEKVANTLTVDGNIIEDIKTDTKGIVPGDETNVTINIEPTSTAKSLIRVKLNPYWIEDGNKSNLDTSNLKILFDDSIKIGNNKGNWYKSGDYLYYLGEVDKNTGIIKLVKGIKFLAKPENENVEFKDDANKYQNKSIGIEVEMDMVQYSDKAYQSRWVHSTMSDELKAALENLYVN